MLVTVFFYFSSTSHTKFHRHGGRHSKNTSTGTGARPTARLFRDLIVKITNLAESSHGTLLAVAWEVATLPGQPLDFCMWLGEKRAFDSLTVLSEFKVLNLHLNQHGLGQGRYPKKKGTTSKLLHYESPKIFCQDCKATTLQQP